MHLNNIHFPKDQLCQVPTATSGQTADLEGTHKQEKRTI